MTPAVSVVTIFLDAEDYLREAIGSVYAQTRADWELILVDDGSTDGSTAIARAAAAADPGRVRYLEHQGHANRGMSASRNAGMAAARAPVLALLDADDVYLPEKLERQLAVLDAHPDVSLVYGPTTLWYGWTGSSADATKDRVYRTKVRTGVPIDPPELFVAYARQQATTPATCSTLFRKELVERVGGFEESFSSMYEDQVFFYKVAVRERIIVLDRSLDLYRQHDRSTSAQALSSGEWHRKDPNLAHARFVAWLRAFARDDPPHARVCRREARRATRRAILGRVASPLRPVPRTLRRVVRRLARR